MKITIKNILKIAEYYDFKYRGGTGRGEIDIELAEVLYKVFAKNKSVEKAISDLSN
jgi:hypothetical protein